MVVYDLPTNVTRMTHLFQWSNGVVDGWIGPLLLFAIFVVSFVVTLQKSETDTAFTFAMILVSVVGIFFRVLSLIDTYVLFICFIFTGLAVWITSKEKSYY